MDVKKRLVSMMKAAIENQATDLHFILENDDTVLFQVRAGHMMMPIEVLEKSEYDKLLSYVKFHSAMDLSQPLQPQSGGLQLEEGDLKVSSRVSILPTQKFHSMVLRVTDHSLNVKLDDLPFFTENAAQLKEVVQIPAGLVVVGGPTSSGKTTTAHTMIDYLKNELGQSVIMIEEPTEYRQPDTVQLQMTGQSSLNERLKVEQREREKATAPKAEPSTLSRGVMSYEDGIKEILRHDPDVIFIGEIRDQQTAKQAMRAALSGHLVITTMHSKDNLGSIHRMMDLGISSNDLTQSLVGLVNQRLVPVGNEKAALMEIASGDALESLMKQIEAGLVTHLPYKTLDETFLQYREEISKGNESKQMVTDEYVEVSPDKDEFVGVEDITQHQFKNVKQSEGLELD